MTFEEKIHEYCLRLDIAYERILFSPFEKDLYILCPSELVNEQIIKDNILKMLKVIREYIKESELYKKCMDRVDKFHFDSQKTTMINEAHRHQEKADKLDEVMNEGISPYTWYYYNTMNGYIVYLDKI
uniref:hypothetical protein n=1 Tax=Coprococcus catus TaxID=116085 RepID=UPI0022E86242|nr:hypothetical protein [Coprococcus catus]